MRSEKTDNFKTMGKKSKQTTSTETNTDTGTTTSNFERLSVQLNDATVQLRYNIMTMDKLHQQWMNYLLVLSLIVVLISTYQIYSNFDSNFSNIDKKIHGYHDHHQFMLFVRKLPKPIQTLLHIDYSIITYILSTCMSIFLLIFMIDVKQRLQQQQPLLDSMTAIFRHFYFRMTQFCFLPTMISYYYYSKNNLPSISTTSSSSSSSILPQQFPIVIVYFVIATVSVWFMQHQAERMYRSHHALVRLKLELTQKEHEQQQKQCDNNDQPHSQTSCGKKEK